jgi:hypothetical protein
MLPAPGRLLPAPFGDASVVIEGATTPRVATGDTELVSAWRLPTLSTLTDIAPMLIPNSIEKNPTRNSRRNRVVGANQPNSG